MRQILANARSRLGAILGVAVAVATGPCAAATWPLAPVLRPAVTAPQQGSLCRAAVRAAEIGTDLPPNRLIAIAMTESARADPTTGHVDPWPWSINVEGKDHVFESKPAAIAYVRDLQARGIKSIDVGCMQVNLAYHPDAFAGLEEAFDPRTNADYAVKFLRDLRRQTGNWDAATAAYHSAIPELGEPYRAKVMRAEIAEAKSSGLPAAPLKFAAAGPATQGAWASPLRSLPTGAGRTGGGSGGVGGAPVMMAQAGTAQAGPRGGTGHGLDFYRSVPVTGVRAQIHRTSSP